MASIPPGVSSAPRMSKDAFLRAAPAQKHMRRTATSVCAGHFDQATPTPRGRSAPSNVLAGVENTAHTRSGSHASSDKLSRGVYAHPSPFTAQRVPSGGSHATTAAARLTTRWTPQHSNSLPLTLSAAEGSQSDCFGDEYSDNEDQYDPVGPVASSPRPMSDVSSLFSYDSRRPLTPFGSEGTSPTATLSPGLLREEHDYYGVFDALTLKDMNSARGHVRPRTTSGATDSCAPAAKRSKSAANRGQISVPAGADDWSSAAATDAHLADSSVTRDRLGRARPGPKKVTHRKGWKGWVEVEVDEAAPPPTTLIRLDAPAVILPERRTRSGKNFDG